jgi:hypothetical protein
MPRLRLGRQAPKNKINIPKPWPPIIASMYIFLPRYVRTYVKALTWQKQNSLLPSMQFSQSTLNNEKITLKAISVPRTCLLHLRPIFNNMVCPQGLSLPLGMNLATWGDFVP